MAFLFKYYFLTSGINGSVFFYNLVESMMLMAAMMMAATKERLSNPQAPALRVPPLVACSLSTIF
jgi:hypothetical protein